MTTTRSTASRGEITASLERLLGEECWAIIAGSGTGSVILLDLGAKLRREVPLRNDALSDEERNFEAPYSVHIWSSWRVERGAAVVGSWAALPAEGWWERSGLALIKGRRLTGYELGDPVPDLRLEFDDVRLSVFADTLAVDDEDCAFTLRTPTDVYLAFSNGSLQREWSTD
jgi:hypothetical protein